MDKVFHSVALVRHSERSKTQLLLRWHSELNQWNFILGQRLGDESFRETIAREVAWELGLDRARDFVVSSMAQLSMEYVDEQDEFAPRHVAVAFYHVHPFGKDILQLLTEDASNRWTNAKEICEGKTAEGHVIDPLVVNWIKRWEVLQPWH